MKEKLKFILKKKPFCPFFFLVRWVLVVVPQKIQTQFHTWKWRERRICFGSKNPEKIFYVIRWDANVNALMGLMNYVLGKIAYAEKKGWIPVVDFKNGRNYYFENAYEIGRYNVWDCFFMPITQYTLDEVYESKNVILGSLSIERGPSKDEDLFRLENTYSEWKKLVDTYITPSKNVQMRLDQLNKIYGKPTRCIAIKIRGTDYNPPPKGHFYQPDVRMIIDAVKELSQNTGCVKAVLSTEDDKLEQQILKSLKTEIRITSLSDNNVYHKISKIEEGQRYLADLLYLSQCEYLVGGINGGLIGVALLASNLREIKTWFLGKAP